MKIQLVFALNGVGKGIEVIIPDEEGLEEHVRNLLNTLSSEVVGDAERLFGSTAKVTMEDIK